MVTLSAVILAVGMVVDASVVVLENIVRLRDEGLSPEDAAREGTGQVWGPVLAGTATTVVVLVPLLSLQGFIGKVFGPLAMTLLIAFSSSVLVALILVPILSLQLREGGRIERWAGTISYPFRAAMDALGRGYLHLLGFGLRWRSVILLAALASFAGGIVGLRSVGMDLLPRMDGGTFTVSFETPSGTSLTETTSIVRQIEELLAENSEVILVQSQAGFEPGMKFSGGSGVMGPTQGFLSVSLSPRTERERTIWEIESTLRASIDKMPGIAASSSKRWATPPNQRR
jgi:multidrug efflux pump subunit AcrB